MEENWYAVEQQVRDRISEARAAARIRTLTRNVTPTARRPNSVVITIIRLANWALARAMQLSLELSRGFANVRAAMKNAASHQCEKGHHRVPRGHPNSDEAVDVKRTLWSTH